MIRVTGTKACSDLRLLWGILLDPITGADFREDVFNGFLVSDRVREVLCEKPKSHGGHGTTREGLFVAEFETQLCGVCVCTYERQSRFRMLTEIIENRIELVTTSDIRDVVYPAFLAPERRSPPVGTRVEVALEIQNLGDFPEAQAFAATERHILNEREAREPIKIGTILPVSFGTEKGSSAAALEILRQRGQNEFEAVIYHEAEKGEPSCGAILERRVTRRNPAIRDKVQEFNARIGEIVLVS